MSRFEHHPLHPGEATPLFIPAGVLKEPAQLEQFYTVDDPDAVPLLVFGGFTLPAWEGNAKPGQQDFVYYPESRTAGNCRGLPNLGKQGILDLKGPIKRLTDMGIKTIVQVTNSPHEQPMDVIPELVDIAASVEPTAVEVNLSCPNGRRADGTFHPPLSTNSDASQMVMEAARSRVGTGVVLGAKDSPHVTSPEDAIDAEEVTLLARKLRFVIDFVCGVNTIGGQPFPELECGGGRGGLSGQPLNRIVQHHIRIWDVHAPNVAYLSTGGVDSENAAVEIPSRLAHGNVIRVGGAQEFYRTSNLLALAERWNQAIV